MGRLHDFLAAGDPAEADWAPRILRLARRGDLGDGGKGLLLDLPALSQPYGCRSAACAPGRRAAATRSCCADLDVSPDPAERAAIEAALPQIAATMADDARWSDGAPALFDGDTLRRPGRRCVFARATAEGLRCGLQETRAALKPLGCQLFPLAVVDLGDGSTLLTAVHRETASMLASRPARVFPCLGDGPPLAVVEAPLLQRLLGARRAAKVVAAVEAYARGDEA
jgi:hypothetical protein